MYSTSLCVQVLCLYWFPLPLYRSKLTRELVDREADLLVRGLDSGDSLKGEHCLGRVVLMF